MFLALLSHSTTTHKTFLNHLSNTFYHIPFDGFNGHLLQGFLVPPSIDLSELPIPDLLLEHILVYNFGHANQMINYLDYLIFVEYIMINSHVMKTIYFILIFSLLTTTIANQQIAETDEQTIQRLQEQIQSLDPNFIHHFIAFYHIDLNNQENINKNTILNISRVSLKQSTYLLLVAKMYLYKILPNHHTPQLKYYQTQSNYLAAYYYLRVAAEYYQNKEAYYLLGVLQQFKLVPDKGLETKLQSLPKRSPQQSLLLSYLQNSHLYNAQSMLFMSSSFGFHPASLTLGYMIKNRLGTTKNCSAALAYYLSVIKDTYVEQYHLRQIYAFTYNLQDELYSRQKILISSYEPPSNILEQAQYFDSEITQAATVLADNYYLGRGGYLRNLKKAAHLYQKLAQNSKYGRFMAGLCYFRGEGVPMDRVKAAQYFSELVNDDEGDENAQFFLIAMKYFQMIEKGTKPKALSVMLAKYKNFKNPKVAKRLTANMQYLIAVAILRGELKEIAKDGKQIIIPEAEGYQLLDKSVAYGNTLAKVLLAILFADGVTGLKYGCEEAIKFLSEEAIIFPYFKDRVSSAQVALKTGKFGFAVIKYMQLVLVGHEDSYINLLYLLEIYGHSVLNMNKQSWSIKAFKSNLIYKQLHENGLVSVQSLILKVYTIKKKAVLNYNHLQSYFIIDDKTIKEYHSYLRKKIIRWGSVFDKKNILKYYQYRLALQEQTNVLPTLTSLAAGQSTKPYVTQARYLLGRHHHQLALHNKTQLTPNEHFRILGQYNRAVKSQFIGSIIFHIEEYIIANNVSFNFFQSQVGQDLLGYIFVVSILIFVFYYLRSKRIDHFHKTELQKQLRKAAQERQMQRIANGEKANEKKEEDKAGQLKEQKLVEEEQIDRNQPIITEQSQPKGVRIGSSLQQSND